jgi:hypothetical protein
LRHTGGLNPRAFRARYSRTHRALGGSCSWCRPLAPEANQALQGDLLYRYAWLDARQQARVADAVGATRGQLLGDLRALAAATAFL